MCVRVYIIDKVFAFFTRVLIGVMMVFVLRVTFKYNHIWNVSRNAIMIRSVRGNKWE